MDNVTLAEVALENAKEILKQTERICSGEEKEPNKFQPTVKPNTSKFIKEYAREHGVGKHTAASILLNLFVAKWKAGKIQP